jgi:argininosuccinate lyase
VLGIIRSLISGYHRDFQLTKGPLMRGIESTLACVRVIRVCVAGLGVNVETCIRSFSPEVFATDRVLDLVKQGVPFRDAYRQVAATLDQTRMDDPVENIRRKTHTGATGNLGLDLARRRAGEERRRLASLRERWDGAVERLVRGD